MEHNVLNVNTATHHVMLYEQYLRWKTRMETSRADTRPQRYTGELQRAPMKAITVPSQFIVMIFVWPTFS